MNALCAAVIGLAVAGVTFQAPDDEAILRTTAQVKKVLESEKFDPTLLESPFNTSKHDPIIVSLEWDRVYPKIADAVKSSLKLDDVPFGRLVFFLKDPKEKLDSKGSSTLVIKLPVSPDPRVEAVLKGSLGLGPQSFLKEGLAAQVQEIVISRDGLRSEFVRDDGSLYLSKIASSLQTMLQSSTGPLKSYHFSATARLDTENLVIVTNWNVATQTTPVEYSWRARIDLVTAFEESEGKKEKTRIWKLSTYFEIGKRFASQATPVVIGNTNTTDIWGNTLSIMAGGRPEPRMVSNGRLFTNRSYQRVISPYESSPLVKLSTEVYDDCLAVLLKPTTRTP